MTPQEIQNDPEVKEMLAKMGEDRVGGQQQIGLHEGDERFEDQLASKFEVGELFGDLVMA